jgi:hypothetical protein
MRIDSPAWSTGRYIFDRNSRADPVMLGFKP